MKRLLLIMCSFLLLSGCAETTLVAQSFKSISQRQQTYKVGNSYRIMGQTYTPREDWNYTETGIASWYGDDFHGKKTANGDTFNKWELTAAHRTLPMPSVVRVTNLDNGRSVQVIVNDRGPFKSGRIIDLSHRAATLLGFDHIGTAKVRVDIMREESMALKSQLTGQPVSDIQLAAKGEEFIMPEAKPEAQPHVNVASIYPDEVVARPLSDAPSAQDLQKQEKAVVIESVKPSNIYVQLASFSNEENAMKLQQQAQSLGQIYVQPTMINGKNYYRVRLGPLATVENADNILAKAVQAGHRDSKIVVD